MHRKANNGAVTDTRSLTFQPNKPIIFNPLLSSRAFFFLYGIHKALGVYM